MKQKGEFEVTKHALVRRIDRALPKDKKLWFSQSYQAKGFERGAYFVIDTVKGLRVSLPLDGDGLEKLAKELSVLEKWESLSK